MVITPQQRLYIYSSLPDDLKEIYSSEITTSLQSNLIEKYQIQNESQYLDLVGDTILGIHNEAALRLRLEQLKIVPPQSVDPLLKEILVYIQPAVEHFKKNEDSSVNIVVPLRTFETDAKQIHGYGAFRAENPRDDEPVYESKQEQLVPPPSYHSDSSTPPKP